MNQDTKLIFTPLAIFFPALVICVNSYWLKAQGGWLSTALSRFPAAASSTYSRLKRDPGDLRDCAPDVLPYQLLTITSLVSSKQGLYHP